MRTKLVLLMIIALFLAACSAPTPEPAAPQEESKVAVTGAPAEARKTEEPTEAEKVAESAEAASRPFVFAVRQEPVTMDPHVNDLSYSQYGQRLVYEALIEYTVSPDGKVGLGPRLAESWDVSDDAKTYVFNLRKDVKFSDGTPFNAEAVKWNLERLLALKLPPSARIPPVESVEVVDDYSVKIVLKSPFAPFLASMTLPLMISPTAAQSHEEEGDKGQKWLTDNAVGTGPYMLESWVRGQELTATRNPDYWRGWEGNHVDKVVLQVVQEPTTQRLILEAGEADLADNIAFDDLDALSQTPGVVVEPGISLEMLNICMKTVESPLADKRIRQAVSYAFDYDSFINGVLNSRAQQPLGPVPFGSWALDQDLQPYTRDLEKAKALMAEAGYPDGGFKVTIQTIAAYGWYQSREAQILQQNLGELGIEAVIDDKADAATFLGTIRDKEKGPEIYFWRSVAAIDDPDYELRRMYHSGFVGERGVNGSWFQDPKADELLDTALTIPSREERKSLYDQYQVIVKDEAPCIWAAQMNYYITSRDVLKGYVWNPFNIGVPDYYQIWLSE
jgi:peptide/nickel transport system substrate-binding protein